MPYIDPNTIHNPATGTVAPAAWGDVIRDDLEFLIDPPACSIFNSTAQSIVTDTLTVLTANSENFDNNGMHSTVTNTSRITIQTAGRYQFCATINSAPSNTANTVRTVQFLVNNTTAYQVAAVAGINSATFGTDIVAVRSLTLAVSDYVEVRVLQNTTANNNMQLVEFYACYLTR